MEIASIYMSERDRWDYGRLLRHISIMVEDSLPLYSTVTMDFLPGMSVFSDMSKMFRFGIRKDVLDNLPRFPEEHKEAKSPNNPTGIDFKKKITDDIPGFWDKIWTKNNTLAHLRPDPCDDSLFLKKSIRKMFSRPLPNGQTMELEETSSGFRWNDFRFGIDTVVPSFFSTRNRNLSKAYALSETDFRDSVSEYIRETDLLGAYTIYPVHANSLIQCIYSNNRIRGRWDFVLECVRRHYSGEDSPLYDCMRRDRLFYDLFVDFNGFIDFFYLNDFINSDGTVKMLLQTELFEMNPVPRNWDEYKKWFGTNIELVKKRNSRMERSLSRKP